MSEPESVEHAAEVGLPRPDQLRRFSVYAETPDAPNGRCLAVGVEFPDGPVFASLNVQAGPVSFPDMAGCRRSIAALVEDTEPAELWFDYEDPEL